MLAALPLCHPRVGNRVRERARLPVGLVCGPDGGDGGSSPGGGDGGSNCTPAHSGNIFLKNIFS